MRRRRIALAALVGVALAGAETTALAQNQMARSDADARRLCGPKPSADPHWRCIGRPRGEPKGQSIALRAQFAYRQITWTWASGGKSASDSWNTH